MSISIDWTSARKSFWEFAIVIAAIAFVIWLIDDGWRAYGPQVKSIASGVLIIAAGIADEMGWQGWAVITGAMVWWIAHRANRKRQERIIALLAEIADHLIDKR